MQKHCFFPQPFHFREPYPIGTASRAVVPGMLLRSGYDECEFPIDAPDVIPSGGVRCVNGGCFSFSSQSAFRE